MDESHRFGPIEWVARTGSTNTDLLERPDAATGTVLIADHQTGGRGRLGRRWEAAPGSSLLLSVLLRPRLGPEHLQLAATAAGLAAVATCRSLGADVGLKWPNDVVTVGGDRDRKLAGVLAETRLDGGAVERVVVGVGLNLAVGAHPPELGTVAVSLDELVPRDGVVWSRADRERLATDLLTRFAARLGRAETDPGGLVDEARRRSATLGRQVRVALGEREVEGHAVDLGPDGHLLVEAGDGLVTIVAGDVTAVRPRATGG